jgi:hypothetical protein
MRIQGGADLPAWAHATQEIREDFSVSGASAARKYFRINGKCSGLAYELRSNFEAFS